MMLRIICLLLGILVGTCVAQTIITAKELCLSLSPPGVWIDTHVGPWPLTCSMCGSNSTNISSQCCRPTIEASCSTPSHPGYSIVAGIQYSPTCQQCGGLPSSRVAPCCGSQCCQIRSAGTNDSIIGVSGKPVQCESLPNPGECRGAFPRFFYNSTSDQCDCFLYGGCDDEEPQYSWLTLADCSATCQPAHADEGPRCKQILNQEDIKTFKLPIIVESPDLSHVNDTALLDMLGGDHSSQEDNSTTTATKKVHYTAISTTTATTTTTTTAKSNNLFDQPCSSLSPPGFWIPAGYPGAPNCYQYIGIPTGIFRPGGQCCQPNPQKRCISLTPPGIWIVAGPNGAPTCDECDSNVTDIVPYGGRCCQPRPSEIEACSFLSPPGYWIAAGTFDAPTCFLCGGTSTNIGGFGGKCCQPDPLRSCSSLSPPGFWIPAGFPGAPNCYELDGIPTGIYDDGGQCCQPNPKKRCLSLSPPGIWIVEGTMNSLTCGDCGSKPTSISDDGGQCCQPFLVDLCSPAGFSIGAGFIGAPTCSQCGGTPAPSTIPWEGAKCCQPNHQRECLSLSPPGFWIPGGFPGAPNCSEFEGTPTGIYDEGGQCCQPNPQKLCSSLSPPGIWIETGYPNVQSCSECGSNPTNISGDGGQCCQPITPENEECASLSPPGFWIGAGIFNPPSCSGCGGALSVFSIPGGRCCQSNIKNPECLSPWFLIGNQCFLQVGEENSEEQLTWASARDFCKASGGDLAQPNDLKELDDYISENIGIWHFWLGGTDGATEGEWHWLNGIAITTGWLPGEPIDGIGLDCVAMHSGNGANSLADWDCETTLPFICQRY